jgi:oligoendopeptidase F
MKQTTWNLKRLFNGDDDPRIEEKRKVVERKSYEFINKWKDRKDYLKNPSILKQALDEYEQWKRDYGSDGDEGYYFWLRTTQDQNNPNLKARFNTIEHFSKKIENDIQFFYLRTAKISEKNQKKFLEYAGLNDYRHFLERIFAESKYLLSEPEEKILNLKTPTSYSNWVKMTSGFLVKEDRKVILKDGKKHTKTFSALPSLMNSKDKKVRDSAAEAFNDILKKHVDVAEAEINSVLANKKVDDELRRISRPDLSRHISDDIDTDIVDALIETVSERFDISSRYYGLKAKLLKVKKLKYHERNVEYGNINKKYPYDKTIKLISRVLNNLDHAFADILQRFTENGQFDVYPGKGKASGAFCAHHLISQPTYILLNHTDKLNDVLTLAHEIGHGINNELIRGTQNALNFGTPISTAEVASTFMEDFVLQEILEQADDELRLSIMIMKLNNDVSTIFRQVACYRFEQELHRVFRQKGYLSKDEIGKIFQKHMAAYMGDYVEQSPDSENWWVYWGHIRSFFYVYSYASGLLISKSLQNAVRENPGYIEKVKEFLSAGLSDSPKAIFKKLGIDITDKKFWNKGLDEVETSLIEATRLAEKLKKIR